MERTGRPKTDAANYKVVHLRLPPPLISKLRARVARNGRPMNTEVMRILIHALADEPDVLDPAEQLALV